MNKRSAICAYLALAMLSSPAYADGLVFQGPADNADDLGPGVNADLQGGLEAAANRPNDRLDHAQAASFPESLSQLNTTSDWFEGENSWWGARGITDTLPSSTTDFNPNASGAFGSLELDKEQLETTLAEANNANRYRTRAIVDRGEGAGVDADTSTLGTNFKLAYTGEVPNAIAPNAYRYRHTWESIRAGTQPIGPNPGMGENAGDNNLADSVKGTATYGWDSYASETASLTKARGSGTFKEGYSEVRDSQGIDGTNRGALTDTDRQFSGESERNMLADRGRLNRQMIEMAMNPSAGNSQSRGIGDMAPNNPTRNVGADLYKTFSFGKWRPSDDGAWINRGGALEEGGRQGPNPGANPPFNHGHNPGNNVPAIDPNNLPPGAVPWGNGFRLGNQLFDANGQAVGGNGNLAGPKSNPAI